MDQTYSPRKGHTYNKLQEEIEEQSYDKSPPAAPVEFKDVYLRYSTRKDYLFEGLSFEVKAGERVALVGQSGTGKTSIADLLFNVYPPQQGDILIDQAPNLSSKKLPRPKMAIVSQ